MFWHLVDVYKPVFHFALNAGEFGFSDTSDLGSGPFCLSLVSVSHSTRPCRFFSAMVLLTEALAAPGSCVLRCQRDVGSKLCYAICELFS